MSFEYLGKVFAPEEITIQNIFDKVATHLLEQNEKSIITLTLKVSEDSEDYTDCAYRGEDGLMCAVGCLIEDSEYDKSLEGFNLSSPRVVKAVQQSIGRELSGDEISLLRDFQKIHDSSEPSKWKEKINNLSSQRGLESSVLDEMGH